LLLVIQSYVTCVSAIASIGGGTAARNAHCGWLVSTTVPDGSTCDGCCDIGQPQPLTMYRNAGILMTHPIAAFA
jgi:hypothetical protein